ncbi:MAG: DUF3667 domain-containing protein [Pseudomonadota bacterium]
MNSEQVYCSVCGERRLDPSDRTVAALTKTFLASVTDLDSRVYRTLRTLITAPGMLSSAFARGQRKPFLGPVQLFILANVVYFLLQPFAAHSGYNTPLEFQLDRQAYSRTLPVAEWVAESRQVTGRSEDVFAAVYNNQSEVLAKSLVFLMVPMFALLMSALMAGTGRLTADHVVFALHYYAFELLVMHSLFMMIWPRLVLAVGGPLIDSLDADQAANAVRSTMHVLLEFAGPILVLGPYLYFSTLRFYETSRWRAAVTAAIALLCLIGIAVVYRVILLIATLFTIN